MFNILYKMMYGIHVLAWTRHG